MADIKWIYVNISYKWLIWKFECKRIGKQE
jgi:hypothetical protein